MAFVPPETLASVDDLRQRIAAGEEVSQPELAAALAKYRTYREAKALTANVKQQEKAAKADKAKLPADLLLALGEKLI